MGSFRLVLVSVVVLAFPALAQQITQAIQTQTPNADDPVSERNIPASPLWVARDYLKSLRDRGFAAMADYVHPDELARFKAMLTPVLEAESDAGGRALMNATFGRDARLTDVRLADPADFLRRFARVMSARMPEQRMDFDDLQVLGSVEEGELVHVLMRLRWESQAITRDRLEVVSLLRFEKSWKPILGPENEAAILAMAPRQQDERAVPELAPQPEPPESEPELLPPLIPGERHWPPVFGDEEALVPNRDGLR